MHDDLKEMARRAVEDARECAGVVSADEFFQQLWPRRQAIGKSHGDFSRRASHTWTEVQWARSGLNTFDLTEALACQLLLTDPPSTGLEDLHFPFTAFAIEIPSGILRVGECEDWAEYLLVGRSRSRAMRPGESAFDDAEWIYVFTGGAVTGQTALVSLSQGHSVPGMNSVVRLIKNLVVWLHSSQTITKTAPVRPRIGYTRRSREQAASMPTCWKLDAAVKLDDRLKQFVHDMAEAGQQLGKTGWTLKVRHIVRGHWRQQAHGPKHSERRLQWIEPFWKGPADGVALAHKYTPNGRLEPPAIERA